jgi:hypothetical protein
MDAIRLARQWLVNGPIDDRALGAASPDGNFSFGLATPGRNGSIFGLPDLDAAILSFPLPGVGRVMGTTIPACKAAVLTLLAARPALTGVVLSWSGPTKDDDYVDELIFLGDTEDTSQWAAGGGIREENYALDVTVWVKLWGDDPQATEQRAHVLWDEVEDALRDDVMAGARPGRCARSV